MIILKKHIIIFNFLLLFIIAGCGDGNLIQDDIERDIDEALLLLDTAYDEKRELNEEETVVLEKFSENYRLGKFLLDDGTEYEMNELEKEIVMDIEGLKLLTISEETMPSGEDIYTFIKKNVDENLKATEIPPEIIGQSPTYEAYLGIHPQLKEDANEIINIFDPIVNGTTENIGKLSKDKLDIFISTYEKMDFEIEGKHYLVNDEGFDVLYTFMELKKAIENDEIPSTVQVLFNQTKESISK